MNTPTLTYIDIDDQVLAEHFDLELEIKLEIGLLMQLSQYIHNTQRPGVGWPEHLAVGAALHHFGHEWHDVEEFLRALVVGFV